MTAAGRYPASRLVAPDEEWPQRYARLARELRASLGAGWRLEHVGSTSVPGLMAKPVIDVALRASEGASTDDAAEPLTSAGWTAPTPLGEHQCTFLLSDGVRLAIGHVFTASQWPEAHVRLFAAWLRSHPADRDRYAELKAGLVSRGVWGSEYTAAKGPFVLDVVNRARVARGLEPLRGPP